MSQQLLPRDFTDPLFEYRRELDALDAQFVSLLAARFEITHRIGALKASHRVAAADPAREQAQLERLVLLSTDLKLPTEVTRAVYETLFRFVRANHLAQATAASARPAELEAEE
ncbi:MAG: chorismate mutase [Pseudomonadota bacterium]